MKLCLSFVGGPFDGHDQPLDVEREELQEVVAFPVNENVLRLLSGSARGAQRPVRSMAVYRLDGPRCYRFVGAWPPRDFHLEAAQL